MIQRTIIAFSLIGSLLCAPMAIGVQSCVGISQQKAASCGGCCTVKKCCFTSEDNQPQHSQPISAKGNGHEFGAAIAPPLSTVITALPPNVGELVSARAQVVGHSPAPFALSCIRLI